MKNLALIVTMAIGSLLSNEVFAQEAPKKGFTLKSAEKNIEITPGETKKVEIQILRSKAYRKTNIDLVVNSSLPSGLNIEFQEGDDPVNSRIMIVSAEPTVSPFQKSIIIQGKSTRFTKGIMLSLAVGEVALSSN